jgi:hypothetical protein
MTQMVVPDPLQASLLQLENLLNYRPMDLHLQLQRFMELRLKIVMEPLYLHLLIPLLKIILFTDGLLVLSIMPQEIITLLRPMLQLKHIGQLITP